VFDHVVMGVANQIVFRSHVIEPTSPPMHEQMTNQVRHVTSVWKTAVGVRTKIFGPTTPPRTLVVGKPRTLFCARAQRVLGVFTKVVVSVFNLKIN